MGGGYYIFFVIISCRFSLSLSLSFSALSGERTKGKMVRSWGNKKKKMILEFQVLSSKSPEISDWLGSAPHVRIIKRSLAN